MPQSIPEKDYGGIEWQAYALAGLILVPTDVLIDRFETACSRLADVGLSRESASEAARHMLHGNIAEQFKVSRQVVEKRILYEKLWVTP